MKRNQWSVRSSLINIQFLIQCYIHVCIRHNNHNIFERIYSKEYKLENVKIQQLLRHTQRHVRGGGGTWGLGYFLLFKTLFSLSYALHLAVTFFLNLIRIIDLAEYEKFFYLGTTVFLYFSEFYYLIKQWKYFIDRNSNEKLAHSHPPDFFRKIKGFD